PTERDLEAKSIARKHLFAELGVVHAAQIHSLARLRRCPLQKQDRCDLRQRLQDEHARHQRPAGKVPLKKLFVHRNVLDRDETPHTTQHPTVHVTRNRTRTYGDGAKHTFAVSRSGAVNVVLPSIAHDSPLVVGLSLGTWNGTACQAVLVKDHAAQGSTLLGSA